MNIFHTISARIYKQHHLLQEKIKSYRRDDPVHNCDYYLKHGCAHVDGYLCEMSTCTILRDHKANIPRQLKPRSLNKDYLTPGVYYKNNLHRLSRLPSEECKDSPPSQSP